MAKMYEDGSSIRECARYFNVDPQTAHHWIRVAGIKTRPQKIAKLKYGCDEKVFDSLNATSVYWLGFLFADGCIHQYERGSLSLNVALSEKDRAHLEALQIFLHTTSPLRNEAKTRSVRLSVRSDTLCQKLIALGCTPRKSLSLVYPSTLPHERHFIRGYFDGDGSVYVNEKVYCAPGVSFVGTHIFLEKLQETLIRDAGINANAIRSHAHSQAKYLLYSGRGNAKKIYDYLYAESGPYLERKKAVFEYALSYHQRKLTQQ